MTDKDTFMAFLKSRPVAFYPDFAAVAGTINAGVLLSQLFYWKDKESDPDGWIYKTQKGWLKELGLTRSEQETARKKLRDLGLVHEKLKGNPSKLYYKVDFDALIEALKALYESRSQDAETLHAETLQPKDAASLQAKMQESSILSLQRLQTKITSETTHTNPTPLLNQYSEKVRKIDAIAIDYPLQIAISTLGPEKPIQAIKAIIQAAEDPSYPRNKLPGSLSALLRDLERVQWWAERYVPIEQATIGPPYNPDAETVEWLRGLTDSERQHEFAEAKRLGQYWPEEVLRTWPESARALHTA